MLLFLPLVRNWQDGSRKEKGEEGRGEGEEGGAKDYSSSGGATGQDAAEMSGNFDLVIYDVVSHGGAGGGAGWAGERLV